MCTISCLLILHKRPNHANIETITLTSKIKKKTTVKLAFFPMILISKTFQFSISPIRAV